MKKLSDSEVSMISGGGDVAFAAGVGTAVLGAAGFFGAGICSSIFDGMHSVATVKARDASKSGDAETTKNLSEVAVSFMKGKYIAGGVAMGCLVLTAVGIGVVFNNL